MIWLVGLAFALDCAPGAGDRIAVVDGPLEVGDTLVVRVRGGVTEPTHVEGALTGPGGPFAVAADLEPAWVEEVRIGCDPVPGDPHSCDDPFERIFHGGDDAVLRFGPLQRTGAYDLVACGTDHPVGEVRQRVTVSVDAFRDFPKLPGRKLLNRLVHRYNLPQPRYQADYGVDDADVAVIWAPFPTEAEARAQLQRVVRQGQPVPGFRGAECRLLGGTFQARWLTGGGFVHVEARGVDLPGMQGIVDALQRRWPPQASP